MAKDIHKYPSELAERFQVRMPDGLRDRLRDAAAQNNRSMNAEIVARLEQTFAIPDENSIDGLKRIVLELNALVKVQTSILERLAGLSEEEFNKLMGDPDAD